MAHRRWHKKETGNVKNSEGKPIEEKEIDTVLAEDIDFSGTMKFKNSS